MTRSSSSTSFYSHISPLDYIVQTPSRVSTSQLRDQVRKPPSEESENQHDRVEELRIPQNNIVHPVYRNQDEEITESDMDFPIGNNRI